MVLLMPSHKKIAVCCAGLVTRASCVWVVLMLWWWQTEQNTNDEFCWSQS